eukprot:Blabericola_migrator_1__7811@NODE_39_length_17554_cov_37_506147_g35_i0_p5_GENE_NODE_39_length_17554_cov_37_506147_g35_i0NODE_39_length_17554_cov_37_506147_g35_i0_p5_ORF_typecomplete_len658_score113_47Sec1/PF00995_23/2_5e103_NODE_39_length_17554_cov_37_506147_g35_i039455918
MSLREICQERFLHQMVGACRQAIELSRKTQGSAFCAMIVDDSTLRYLSSACKVYDILEAGVSVIESINKSRQPLPDLDAIYFLSPNQTSVEALTKDYKNDKKPQHRTVHLFWSTTVANDPNLLKPLVTPPLLSRIKTFVDFNLSFVAYESRAFHLDLPHSLLRLYPPKKDSDEDDLCREIASRLATACLTLGDKPNIRFHMTRRGLNEKIATLVQQYCAKVKPDGVTRGQTELVIVDRSVDATSLLVHEYTYQALAYDVLNIPCCTPYDERMKQSGEETSPDDTYQFMDRKEVKTLLLGEHDDVYVKYRHQHITVVIRGVADELRKFSRDNAAAQYAAAGGKKATEKDIASAIKGLPQYREMLAKFWAHITLSDACFNALQNQGVFKAGYLEQDLATGVDKDGKLVQVMQCLSQLGTMVSEKSGVQTQEKARLLMLYFVTMDGVQEDDKKKMMGAAGLSLDMITVINNFLALGLHSGEEDPDKTKPSSLKHVHKMHADEERTQFFQRKAKSTEYTLSRFEPTVKDLMERAASKRLPRSKYPYLSDPESRQLGAPVGRFGQSDDEHRPAGGLRAAHFDWDWGAGNDSTANVDKKLEQKVMQSKDKVILFVIGGITMSEIRSAYDVSRLTGVDVYIGGTSILTPPCLFDSLRHPLDETV